MQYHTGSKSKLSIKQSSWTSPRKLWISCQGKIDNSNVIETSLLVTLFLYWQDHHHHKINHYTTNFELIFTTFNFLVLAILLACFLSRLFVLDLSNEKLEHLFNFGCYLFDFKSHIHQLFLISFAFFLLIDLYFFLLLIG